MQQFPERDWRHLREIRSDMLEELSARLTTELKEILSRPITENEKRQFAYDLIHTHDKLVSNCFNEWSRSRVGLICMTLQANGLFTEEQLGGMSPETREWIELTVPKEG